MIRNLVVCCLSFCLVAIGIERANAWPLEKEEIKEKSQIFKRWWDMDLEWRIDKLPKSGKVERHRVPWSGYIYPDFGGGCYWPLNKYDQAFHPRTYSSSRYEQYDMSVRFTPHWAGHCNGWTAAAIRHAEPRNSVTRNGVVFSPSDIKGLLAELYVHNAYEPLAGDKYVINPAIFHVTLGNWIGLRQHPVAMDNSPGWEIWNYPIYAYKAAWAKRGERLAEVRINIAFVNSTDREYDQAPKRYRFMYFHYDLDLDNDDKIVGGSYYWDSSRIDLLWVPLQPIQGGQKGNDEGNPHLKVREALALWRDSVPSQYRDKWHNIDPTTEDALKDSTEEKKETVEVVAAVENESGEN